MRYDSYESKIVKIAKFFKLIFKHRVKIIISTAVMLTMTVALLATRGIIVGAKECPDEILYGDKLDYSAGAFISKTSYEYSSDGEEWTSEHPIMPGSYYVRAAAKATFGIRYGEPQPFKILPRPIQLTIADTNVQYGDLPKLTADLAYNDAISCEALIYGDVDEAGRRSVIADLSGIKILSKKQVDVTSCYVITPVAASISVVPRNVNLVLENAEKVYDATPLIPTKYSLGDGALVNGDRFEITLSGSQTEVGSSLIGATYKFYDKNGKDISALYNVNTKSGELKITPREITIYSGNDSKVYDTLPLSFENHGLKGTLADGHTLEVSGWTSITNAGELENSFDFLIKDALGTDPEEILKNYAVKLEFGTLKVEKRPVIITTGSHEFRYDGSARSYGQSDILSFELEGNENSGLCQGHEIVVTANAVFKNVSDSGKNSIQFEIYEGKTPIDKNNYEIDLRLGDVKIEARPLVIKTGGGEFTYDDSYHTFTNEIFALAVSGDENSGLCQGQEIVVTSISQFRNVSDSGKNEIEFEIYEGKEPVDKNNYAISTDFGTVTVTPIYLVLESPDYYVAYDGRDHEAVAGVADVFIKEGSLVPGHYFEIIEKTTVNDVVTDLDNYFKVEIIGNDLKPATPNYVIEYDYGKITVTPPSLTVNMKTDSRVYDGTSISIGYDSTEGLVLGHELVVIAMTAEKNVGEYINTITSYDIINEAGISVKHNYISVTVNDGTLTITQRKIKLVTGSDSKIYDNTPLYATWWDCAAGYPDSSYYGLVAGHKTYTVGSFTELTNAGTVTNGFSGDVYILDENDQDVSFNYIIERGYGILTVYKRDVVVVTKSDSFVYDGKDHVYGNDPSHVWVKEGDPLGLCQGHYLVITNRTSFRNVAYFDYEKANTLECIVVNSDINANYNLIPEYGNITVTPRPLKVTTLGDVFTYDGYSHEYGQGFIFLEPYNAAAERGLCETHSFAITANSVFKEVKDTGRNNIGFEIREGNTPIDKHNYAIEEDFGTVTVNKRPIIITTGGDTFVYDGKTHEYGASYITAESYSPLGRGLCQTHSLYVTGTSKFKEVKNSGRNDIPFEIREGTTVIDKDNYAITENFGTVTVTKRPIIITTVGETFTYDGYLHEYGVPHISAEAYNPTGRGLCETHSLHVLDTSKFKEVKDTGKNDIPFQIKDGSTVIDKDNYAITENFGMIRINRRNITISTSSDSFVYDGKTHTYGYGHINAEPHNAVRERGLCAMHSIYVVADKLFKNVADSGPNNIEYQIREGTTVIDKDNYTITEDFGTVTVTLRPITVTSESYYGPYTGEELNLNTITVSTTEGLGLCQGHSIKAEDKIYKDIVNDVENDVVFDILDEEELTAKENYEITYVKGRVTIYARKILVTTASESWKYDGKEHSAPTFKFSPESELILPDHRLIVVSGTVITNVGSVENTLVFKVVDAKSFDDVSRYYEINQIKGTLLVYDDGPVIDTPNFPENPDIGLPEGAEDEEPVVLFVIKSESTGLVYLKEGSYGNYTGSGWLEANEYSKLLLDYASAYYLNAMAASNANLSSSSILIDSKQGIYVIPYYAIASGHVQVSDTVVTGDASSPYTVYYYPEIDGAYLNDSLLSYEAEYRKFVYDNYLSIDDETRTCMNKIIQQERLSANDIEAVANYIMNAATYDLKYDRALDSESNVVKAFLEKYKSGICQHYASAATMLFRAPGVPARYTVGYVGNAKAGIETEITSSQAHAWVEIYLDGIGWVQVEVTGAGAGGSFDGDGDPGAEDEEEPYLAYSTITVRPASQAKEYDSYPLYPKNEVDKSDEILRQLLAYGYSYEIKTYGSQTEIGVGTSYVDSFTIYNHKGEDITSFYTVVYETGTLHVSYSIIEIYLYEKIYEYSSDSYHFLKDEYFVTKISDELVFEMEAINISLTNAGWISSEDINRDPTQYLSYKVLTKSGADVTDKCYVKVVSYPSGGQYDVMMINKRQITVTTGSATREYDSTTPLTNPSYYMSHGKLGTGHTLYVEVTGSQLEPGTSKNAVNSSATRITDEYGNDCTPNYKITWELGKLVVTE